jgi:hypothetical protein
MASAIEVITALEAAFGLVLNGTNLGLVLSQGRKAYHYVFAVLLATCFIQ